MFFIGIIEANQVTVQEIIQYFFGLEQYSVLFSCRDMEEFKSLPLSKRLKADIIMLDAGENNFDRLWQIKYLKQGKPDVRVMILTDTVVQGYLSMKLKEAGASCFIHKQNVS